MCKEHFYWCLAYSKSSINVSYRHESKHMAQDSYSSLHWSSVKTAAIEKRKLVWRNESITNTGMENSCLLRRTPNLALETFFKSFPIMVNLLISEQKYTLYKPSSQDKHLQVCNWKVQVIRIMITDQTVFCPSNNQVLEGSMLAHPYREPGTLPASRENSECEDGLNNSSKTSWEGRKGVEQQLPLESERALRPSAGSALSSSRRQHWQPGAHLPPQTQPSTAPHLHQQQPPRPPNKLPCNSYLTLSNALYKKWFLPLW